MFGRYVIRLSLAIIVLGYVAPLVGGEIADFLSTIPRDFKRRNCWPEPFVHPDRAAVRQTNAIQICDGWERQNLLSDYHFLSGGSELTEDGRLRVQWIMNEVPEPHRQVFVHRANTPQETAVRMQAVQRLVSQMPYAVSVPVFESTRTDEGWPADRIDSVGRSAEKAAIPPKLLGTVNNKSPGGS
jgi:hypothetical protein